MKIKPVHADALEKSADILVLKYADAFHGADAVVASKLGLLDQTFQKGTHQFFKTHGKISPTEVLFLGVGPLRNFDYSEIAKFSQHALNIISNERPQAKEINLTVHGPGYGLDELAAIDSLVSGIRNYSLVSRDRDSFTLSIIERNERRFDKLKEFLASDSESLSGAYTPQKAKSISSDGKYDKRLFAAMPFKEKFLDHWEFALEPAAHSNNVVIERLDNEHFVGEILSEIRARIERASAVIALLDDNNPNVFLEVGYAWGVRKPTILALHVETLPPFDVSGHKLIRYKRLGDLRAQLEDSLAGLLINKVF